MSWPNPLIIVTSRNYYYLHPNHSVLNQNVLTRIMRSLSSSHLIDWSFELLIDWLIDWYPILCCSVSMRRASVSSWRPIWRWRTSLRISASASFDPSRAELNLTGRTMLVRLFIPRLDAYYCLTIVSSFTILGASSFVKVHRLHVIRCALCVNFPLLL